MMLGVRAHDFGKLTIEEHAKKISEKGFKGIQLALAKAIHGLDAGLGRLNQGMAHYIHDVLLNHQIRVAVLGCYINPVHPDLEERRRQLARFKEHIRHCRDFGCSVVATETGSLNTDFSYARENHGEEAFQTLLKSVGELVEEAERFGVMVAVEGVRHYVAHNPERIRRLIDEIGSNHLQVVFDPVNMITPENYQNQEVLIQRAFDLFGDRIQALHTKDFVIENGRVQNVPPGKGLLDYKLIFSLYKAAKPHGYVLLEDIRPEAMDEAKAYLTSMYEQA